MTASARRLARTTSTARSISSVELMPVESRIGRPSRVIRSMNGRLLVSPDATFQAATPTRSRSSIASTENGELRNQSLFSSACFFRPCHALSENSMRFQ